MCRWGLPAVRPGQEASQAADFLLVGGFISYIFLVYTCFLHFHVPKRTFKIRAFRRTSGCCEMNSNWKYRNQYPKHKLSVAKNYTFPAVKVEGRGKVCLPGSLSPGWSGVSCLCVQVRAASSEPLLRSFRFYFTLSLHF
jgi:hypothetical protein